jgi:hypothetical protein
MNTVKKIWSAILLVTMLGLAGCPDMVQKDDAPASGGSRSSSGE